MKFLPLLIFFLLPSMPLLAAGFGDKVDRELQSFYRDFLKEHPDAVETKSRRRAVDKLIEAAKKRGILSVSEDQNKAITDGDDPVSNEQFWAGMDKLKSVNPTDQESLFLLQYVGIEAEKRKRFRGAEAFALSQLANIRMAELEKERQTLLEGALEQIVSAYEKKIKADKTKRPSFEELGLAEQFKQFIHPLTGESLDWVYLGDKQVPVNFGTGLTPVVVTPVVVEGAHLVATSPKQLFQVAQDTFSNHLKNAPKMGSSDGTNGPSSGPIPTEGIVGEVVKAYSEYRDTHAGQHPKVISQIGIDKQKLVIEGELRWVFVTSATEARQVIQTAQGQAVILCQNRAEGGRVKVVLENGQVSTTSEDFLRKLKQEALK